MIGPGCVVGNGSRLKNCTIMRKTKIGKGCFIENSIISWECEIGDWARIEGLSAISEEVKIGK